MSADGRYDKLLYYRQKLDSFQYAGLKREEAEDLLHLAFRLYRDSEHMVDVKNELERQTQLVEKLRKRKASKKDVNE
jgi:hypothetical protein